MFEKQYANIAKNKYIANIVFLTKNKQYNTKYICVILFPVDIRIHRFTLLYQTFFFNFQKYCLLTTRGSVIIDRYLGCHRICVC